MAKSKQSKRKRALEFRVKELIYWREAADGLRPEVTIPKDQCKRIANEKAQEVDNLLKTLKINSIYGSDQSAWLNNALSTRTLKEWASGLFEKIGIAA